ncbi:DUF808 domain-containing protein [Haliea sp. E1-2-M8]|uniref:DUF808 domain-containing protein n=1 Tax=Haliea sp. E1-2-M8 TaxID=3064706 RepID=UPI00271C9201|nr:DUF808 domain-containing protein [Haliea sp. E1-2-M8]MDO8860828.1 DUF808 domain-containing protein [Haliea sp. E1-2-M8]
MAGTSLLALLDDIATILDDVAVMSKVALRKTAGVLGDDLAVNAEQVSGVRADRELAVVWAVAKGSFRNKLILVPAALLVSVVAPVLIPPVLMLGGLYLCYEGFEKVAHSLFDSPEDKAAHRRELRAKLADPKADLVKLEQQKIRGAIRTDFILSAEIIVITLGTAADAALGTKIAVVAGIAVLITVGVYGLVAVIVKLDDAGVHLAGREGSGMAAAASRVLGRGLLVFAPRFMKTLTIVGTLAMFMVGGGILAHGLGPVDAAIQAITASGASLPVVGPAVALLAPTLLSALFGAAAGAVVLALVSIVGRLRKGWAKGG